MAAMSAANARTRILGVDFGDRRTGVAVSDPFGWTAQGLEVVKGGFDTAVAQVAGLAAQYEVCAVVVGYPLNMNGTAGPRAERTDMFIEALAKRTEADGVEIIRWDERLTSAAAARTLREGGVRPSSRAEREKGRLDVLSAMILLQSYLDGNTKK